MERKKKVVVHSNFSLAKTGFGRHCKLLLSHLYKTGKYDVVEYAAAPLRWSDPACKAMPWKCYGALPDDERELAPYMQDSNQMTAIRYGDLYINKVVEEEKPDVMIMIEDIWGIQHFNKPWNNKLTCVYWTPIDSLPLLPVFADNKTKLKNLWVKAKFAQRALAEVGVESKFMPALIDHSDFQILSDQEREELRKKFGISKNTLVFGFVFRNQLRKLVGTLIEAFSIFQKENPNIDAKLFLHTCWSEPEGWSIDNFMQRFGVKREDILVTHICSNCKHVTVKPFFGEDAPCIKCKHEKSVRTVSSDFGVTNKELCELYNLCDAYIHPATSGGFEMPVFEAMLCGLPTATTNYSYGEDFVESGIVYPLTYTIYHERGSQFNKAQVHPESIVDFMGRVANMSKMDRKETGQKLRKWAIETYDSSKVCKEIEKFIDNSPFIEYDFDISSKKNENYPMPEIEDNAVFVQDLYKNIFKTDISNNPHELNSALNLFKQGLSKKEVYDKFINIAKSYNAKSKQVDLNDLLDKNGKKRILYVEPGGFGDCIDSVAVVTELSNKFSSDEYDIYIASSHPDVFEHLTFIKRCIPYDSFLEDVLAMEGIDKHEGFFDMAFHSKFVRTCLDYYKNNN